MIREITFGQYYNVDSPVHRLDPRVKIVFTLVYAASLFLARKPILYVVVFLVLAVYIWVSRVPLKFIFKGLRTIWLIILFAMVTHLFTGNGIETVFEWKMLRITRNGIASACYMGARLVFMMIGSSMMTYTTTPNALTDGLEKMLHWLKAWKVPVHEFSMVMSIALRFVPILVEELNKIMKAQTARGIDFNEGGLLARLRKWMPLLIPLFVSAVRRSNELALAMDARCYHGGEGRTKMKPLEYQWNDRIAYVLIWSYLAGMIVLAAKL